VTLPPASLSTARPGWGLTCLTGSTGHCRLQAVRGLCAPAPVLRGLWAPSPRYLFAGGHPRIMAQPGVALHDAFPLVPPLSPVELAMWPERAA
jgi:hypothetical protein